MLNIPRQANVAEVAHDTIELFYFALQGSGGIVRTGIPLIKLKELKAKMGLKSAYWISFDDISREFACYAAFSTLKNGNRAAKIIIPLLHSLLLSESVLFLFIYAVLDTSIKSGISIHWTKEFLMPLCQRDIQII